jgi:hypothetical protein
MSATFVAGSSTSSRRGSAARYAWAVVVTAAGLSGLAQAVYLASGATLDASLTLRFGIGAWPAVAAAIAAHLLYLLVGPDSAEPPTPREPEVADHFSTQVQQVRPIDQPPLPDALDATRRPSPASVSRPTVAFTDLDVLSTRTPGADGLYMALDEAAGTGASS